MKKIITFLTDFGSNSSYVAQMKGIAYSLTDAYLIDITHEITPQNIREGAFILQNTIPYYPSGTIHVAVVDPGVGSNRKGLVITTSEQILIGPDNGILIPAAKKLGNFTVYEIQNKEFFNKEVSNTFHGRDIFTPVAAYILNGAFFKDIGPITNQYINLDFGRSEILDKSATGKVVYIDSFGNIITNINGKELMKKIKFDTKIMIFIDDKQINPSFVKSYNYIKKDEILATIGSSDYFEIAINQGNASKKLKIKPDDEVKILFS